MRTEFARKALDSLLQVADEYPEAWPALLPFMCQLSDIVDDAAIAEWERAAVSDGD